MKHKLKYLGIGLFVAGVIFSLGERFEIPFVETNKNVTTNSETHFEKEITLLNKTIATLEDEVEKLNNENVELLNSSGNTRTDEETDSTNFSGNVSTGGNTGAKSNSSSDSSSPTDVVTGTIYIYESVTLYDIGRQVEDLHIIENGRELELYLAKPEYSRSIQKGVFELSSDMTLDEMAKILTGKK